VQSFPHVTTMVAALMCVIRNLTIVVVLASLLSGCATFGCGGAGAGPNRAIGICGVGGHF